MYAAPKLNYVDETGNYIQARIEPLTEVVPETSLEVEALMRNVRSSIEKAVNLGKSISPEVMAIIANLDDAGRLSDLSASNLEFKVDEAQSVLELLDVTSRLRRVNELLEQRDRSPDRSAGDQYSGRGRRSTVHSASSTCASR